LEQRGSAASLVHSREVPPDPNCSKVQPSLFSSRSRFAAGATFQTPIPGVLKQAGSEHRLPFGYHQLTSASRWATWCAGATPGKPSVLMLGTFGLRKAWVAPGQRCVSLLLPSDCLKPRRNGPAGSCGTGSGRRHAHPTERRRPVSGVRGTAPRTVLGSSPWCR